MRSMVLVLFILGLAACPGPGESTGGGSAGSTSATASGIGGGSGGAPPKAHVAVRVTDASQQPVAGAAVVVHDADGKVVDVVAAGADGKNAVEVPVGGSVAAYHAFGLSFVGVAVVDPPDGAVARLVLRGPAPLPPTTVPVTAYMAKVSQIPATIHDLAVHSCAPAQHASFGSVVPASTMLFLTNTACPTYPTASFLLIAHNAQNLPIAWGAALDQPTSPGGTQAVALPMTHTSFDDLLASITSIPPGAIRVGVSLSPKVAAASPLAYDLLQAGSGSAQLFAGAFHVPQGIFQSHEVTERVDFYAGVGESHLLRRRSYGKLPATTSFPADALALVSVDPLDVADPSHPIATWAVSEGPRGDHAKVTLGWTSGTATHAFTAFLPPEHAAAFRMPDLPAELDVFAPSVLSAFGAVTVEYTDEETVAGYAASSAFHDVPVIDGSGVVASGSTAFTHVP